MKLLTPIFFAITFLTLVITSCKVSENAIPGIYLAGKSNQYQLKLFENKNFELHLAEPTTKHDHLSPETRTIITGMWKVEKNRLFLFQPVKPNFEDSITRFSNISSFNFWDISGNPIPIRYILIPTSKLKPHFGNSLYFFAQDFHPNDTLTFYFEDYPPFKFPGSVPATIGNNIHKITMQEPKENYQSGIRFIIRKKRLRILANELPSGSQLKREEKVYTQQQTYP